MGKIFKYEPNFMEPFEGSSADCLRSPSSFPPLPSFNRNHLKAVNNETPFKICPICGSTHLKPEVSPGFVGYEICGNVIPGLFGIIIRCLGCLSEFSFIGTSTKEIINKWEKISPVKK